MPGCCATTWANRSSTKETRRRAKARHRVVATGLGEEPQRLRREVVVLLVERVPTGVGERELPGRPATPPHHHVARVAGLDVTLLDQLVEVPADRSRGQVQPLREGRRGGRPVDQDGPGDALAGRPVRGRCDVLVHFHNTSVTLMVHPFQPRVP